MPESQRKRAVTVKLAPALVRALRREARRRGLSQAALVARALTREIGRSKS